MPLFDWPAERALDVICLGRAGVDLYAREAQQSFSEVSGFNKYVGGSPANIAAALAKLGTKTGFIGAVSDDGLGSYVCAYLSGIGVNLDGMQIRRDGSRTSLAVTEMRPDSPEVVIYRNHAADLTLHPRDIREDYLASSKLLLVSGTALCASPSREAVLLAMEYARRHAVRIVLDMDYRAYSWESPEAAAVYYHLAARQSDVVIGNREEFAVLQPIGIAASDDQAIARHYLQAPTQVLIIKQGADGCRVFHPDGDFRQGIFPVQAQKPFGAGDAFAGGLLHALLQGLPLPTAVQWGTAAAAINVAGNSCSEAMPNRRELINFLAERGIHSSPEDI